jgi:hypothetical protein
MSMRREAAFGGWNREHAVCLRESCRGSDSERFPSRLPRGGGSADLLLILTGRQRLRPGVHPSPVSGSTLAPNLSNAVALHRLRQTSPANPR